jgi:hypothetical protein
VHRDAKPTAHHPITAEKSYEQLYSLVFSPTAFIMSSAWPIKSAEMPSEAAGEVEGTDGMAS